MEKLANLTQTDINNGALIHMLANAGIPDIQEYVRTFHQKTEDLILEDFEHHNPNEVDNDEQIVPPADIQRWIAGLGPRLNDDPNQQLLSEKQQQPQEQPIPKNAQSLIKNLQPCLNSTTETDSTEQQKMPTNVQMGIAGLRIRSDESIQPLSHQQDQEKQPPTDLKSWMQGMTPINLHSSTDITITQTTTTTTITTTPDDDTNVTGNLGTWLHDWSKSLAEQPPPTSLDNWLKSLVSDKLHEPIGKATSPKGRLNSYLNAAQQVLSEHGYNVSNEVTPRTNVETKTSMFGNVKQMYFLWKTLDKNNDRKITVEDIQIMLQEMGLGFLSKYVAQTLFDMVDSNHDGKLEFRDFIALMSIIKQLISTMGSAKTKA